MSDNKLPLKSVIKDIAKRQQLSGLSTADFRKKTETALRGAGFEKTRAKIIAQGIQSGTNKASPVQTEKVLRALAKGKVIKSISDVKGTVSHLYANQKKQTEVKDNKGELKEKLGERMSRENLRHRADETIKEMKDERETGKKEYSSVKEKQATPINYGGSGAVKKTTGPETSAGFNNFPNVFEKPPTPPALANEISHFTPDKEVQSLNQEAKEHDLPID